MRQCYHRNLHNTHSDKNKNDTTEASDTKASDLINDYTELTRQNPANERLQCSSLRNKLVQITDFAKLALQFAEKTNPEWFAQVCFKDDGKLDRGTEKRVPAGNKVDMENPLASSSEQVPLTVGNQMLIVKLLVQALSKQQYSKVAKIFHKPLVPLDNLKTHQDLLITKFFVEHDVIDLVGVEADSYFASRVLALKVAMLSEPHPANTPEYRAAVALTRDLWKACNLQSQYEYNAKRGMAAVALALRAVLDGTFVGVANSAPPSPHSPPIAIADHRMFGELFASMEANRLRGSPRGSRRGPFRGSRRGPFRGPFRGSRRRISPRGRKADGLLFGPHNSDYKPRFRSSFGSRRSSSFLPALLQSRGSSRNVRRNTAARRVGNRRNPAHAAHAKTVMPMQAHP